MSDFSLGTLYDVNKNLVLKNEIELTDGILNSKKEIIINFMRQINNSYYMLLCNEKKDYTVFKMNDKDNDNSIREIVSILINECLKNRGEIRGIDVTKDKSAIEIWLIIEEEAYCYYFFPYDAAIIEV